MAALHLQLDLFLTGGTYHNATCRYANYTHEDQPLYPARIETFSLSHELPDPLLGGLAKRTASITLSDQDLGRLDCPTLAAILATENPKGKPARARLWDPDTNTVVLTIRGVISSLGQDYRSLSIEGDDPALLQTLLPTSRALAHYPSLDTSSLESRDPPPIVVFGPMPRVTLGLALATSLTFSATMGGIEANKFVYADLTNIPNYTVAAGDRLVYDIRNNGAGQFQAIDLRCLDLTVLRATLAKDQNEVAAGPGANLDTYANAKWYRRDIDLALLVGKTITEYMLGGENDTAGTYTTTIANAYILDANEVKKVVIFDETILTAPFTYQTRNSVSTTASLTVNRTWDYGPIRPAVGGAVSVVAVYVDGRVRESSAYSYVLVHNWRFIRFTSRPLASQGGPARVQADLNSTEFGRNPANVLKFIWSDSTMLNQSVNAASFAAAAAVYADIGDHEKVVNGLAERKSALQLLRDLNFRGAYFDRNDTDEVTIVVDTLSQHPSAPVQLGSRDPLELRNAEVETNNSLSNSIADQTKQIDYLAYQDPGLGSSGKSSYLISATRNRATGGTIVTRESPYCGSGKMADREGSYLFKLLAMGDLDIEIRTGIAIGKQLTLGYLLIFLSPRHYFSGGQFLLRSIRYDGNSFLLGLSGWDTTLFTYTPGIITASRLVDALIDYSQTAPSTPTSPNHLSSTVFIGDDGAALVIERFQVTLPSVNCTELRMLCYRTGTGQTAPFQSVSKTNINLGTINEIEVQVPVRLVYDIEFYAFNGGNHPDHQFSLPALITGRIAGADTSAPSVPTGLTATVGTGKAVSLDWANNPEKDLAEYQVFRGPSNPPTVKIAEVKASRFVDISVVIGTLYWYAITAVDRSENPSAKCAAVSAIPILIPGDDTSTVVPNTPGAPTFNAEGTYFSFDGTSIAFIEVTSPAMPLNGVGMNILYRPSGMTAWSIANQVQAGGVDSRVDDLIPGRTYQFAAQAFSVFGRASVVSATLTRQAPFDTTAPAIPVLRDCVGFNQRTVMVDWADNTETDLSEYEVFRQSMANLIQNFSFETLGAADWVQTGVPGGGESIGQNPFAAKSGAYGLRIQTAGTALLWTQVISVTNGATYTFGGWMRMSVHSSGTAALRINTGAGGLVSVVQETSAGGWIFGYATFVAAGPTVTVICRAEAGGDFVVHYDNLLLCAGTPTLTTKIAEVRASRYTDTDAFVVGTAYWYAVTAVDRTENESVKSNFMAATPVQIPNEDLPVNTPLALTGLGITTTGTYQAGDGTTLAFVSLSWTNPADTKRALVEVAYRRTGNTTSYLIADQLETASTARIDDLTPGLPYDYRVRGISHTGYFGVAATLANQTAPGDTTAPAQVTGLALSDHPPRGILARWAASTADDLAHYQIQSATNSGFTTALVTRTAKTTELPLTGLVNGTTYFVRVRALDLTGNAGTYSTTINRLVPRNGTDDQDDDSITTLKIRDLNVTNAKIGAAAITNAKIGEAAISTAQIQDAAITNAKINSLSAVKITTGLFTVNPTIGGATAISVNNAGKIRLQSITGVPSKIVFEDGSGIEKAQIQGKPVELDIDPTSDGGLTLVIGEFGLRWSSVLMQSVNSISLKGDNVFIDAKLATPNFEASPPALSAPNRRWAVYSLAGTFLGYLWGSSS